MAFSLSRFMVFSLIHFIENGIAGYTDMTCYSQTDYANNFQGNLWGESMSSYLLAGVAYSDYDTSTNDRKWKYRFCRPSDATFSFSDESELDITESDTDESYGASFTRQCSGNYQGMSAVFSTFVNSPSNDREWTWTCATFDSSKYNLTDCAWSAFVNNGYDDFTYECPNNGILYGAYSERTGTDRKWVFNCCRLQGGSTSDPTSAPTNAPTYSPTYSLECQEVFRNNANNDGEQYVGQATSMDECMQLVQENCDWANIANVQSKVDDLRDGEAAECWCQNGDDSTPDNSSYWLNCWFGESLNYPTREPTNSTRESTASTRGESVGHVVMAAVILVICCSV